MLKRLRSRLTYANVASSFALFIALTTGGAYAANEWTGDNIVDGSLTYVDLATNTIGSARILDDSLLAQDLAPNSVASSEIANESVTASELATDSVHAGELADDSVDGGEVVNGSLSGSDIQDSSLSSADLAANSAGASEIAADAVGASELASNAVDSAAVANNTLTAADLRGAQVNGTISLTAGFAANGRCVDVTLTVPGAAAGEVAVISLRAPLTAGILIYGVRAPAADQVTAKACNFTGGAAPEIDHLPIAVLTLGL